MPDTWTVGEEDAYFIYLFIYPHQGHVFIAGGGGERESERAREHENPLPRDGTDAATNSATPARARAGQAFRVVTSHHGFYLYLNEFWVLQTILPCAPTIMSWCRPLLGKTVPFVQ